MDIPGDDPGLIHVQLPNNFTPRSYQEPVWTALESGIRRVVWVAHRRAGKDLTFLNWTACECFRRTGLYWHMLPTYKQGRRIVWNGMDRTGRPFLDAFPPETILRKLDQEMTIWLRGGSIWQVVGTDDMDSLVGSNPVGCVFSEYSLQDPAAWEFLRPILTENGGWAAFIYTPRGRNHGHALYETAMKNMARIDLPRSRKWFCEVLTRDDTNAISEEAVQDERDNGMPEEMIQQEFYCSWNAPLVGSYYGDVLAWMEDQKEPQITTVPHVPNVEVVTGWDLGKADSTAIWFAQYVGRQWRVIDYEEHRGEDVAFYAKLLRDKVGYVYGPAYVPHDARQDRLGADKTVLAQMISLGIKAICLPKYPLIDQIAAVRLMLKQFWVDKVRCERGLQALREYVKQAIEGERGPGNEKLYRDIPLHNWASHGASGLASLVMGIQVQPSSGPLPQPDDRWIT